jgi:hypothetical protein
LIDALARSHSMRLADAPIGATALEHDLTLLPANTKHFGAIEGLQLETFAPWPKKPGPQSFFLYSVPSFPASFTDLVEPFLE